VQGVGFRYTVKSVARGFEAIGIVRNLADGRVELVAEGVRDELEAFRGAIRESGLAGLSPGGWPLRGVSKGLAPGGFTGGMESSCPGMGQSIAAISATTMLAPSAASRAAIALPMPLPAPVTIAVLPFSFMGDLLSADSIDGRRTCQNTFIVGSRMAC